MRYLILSTIILFGATNIFAQNKALDSINKLITKATSDTQSINLKASKFNILSNGNLDSAIIFGKNLIEEAKKINYKPGEAKARIKLAGDYCFTGKFADAKTNLDISKDIFSHINDSTTLAKMYNTYGMTYSMQNKFDSAHPFFNTSIEIAKLINDRAALSTALQNNAIAFQQESDYAQALSCYQQALNAAEQIKDEEGEAYIYLNIAITYSSLDEKKRAEYAYLKAIDIAKKRDLKNVITYSYSNLASLYNDLKDYKKEYDAAMKAVVLAKETGDMGIEASSLSRAAMSLANQNNFSEAEKLNLQSIAIADSSKQPYNIYQTYSGMAEIVYIQKDYKRTIPYFEKAFQAISKSDIYDAEVGKSYADLSESYEKIGNFEKALTAYKISKKISDSISGKENIKKSTELTLNYEFAKKQQIEKDEQQKKNDLAKARQTGLIIGLILTIILGAVAFNGFRNKRKSNILLQQEKEKVEVTLSELKNTQAQLVQAEKMASLGELTAGIAHEIQNPLNFVNNFSEVNKEMIEEIIQERNKAQGTRNEDLENELLLDIKENSEKINHHGKRADAIVKGMLQHSRSSSSIKELTDINELADEYLRLAYHGLRAKENSFNATIKTDFDKSINAINIIPQDISRVLLNLFSNAFYAVNEKLKAENKKGEADYSPTVSVQTKKINNIVEIKVTDNGNGIPSTIINKIFQPFFTTKPTGQGTGLGLSLSYDIIKAHGGEIKAETKQGEGTTFIIQIPVM